MSRQDRRFQREARAREQADAIVAEAIDQVRLTRQPDAPCVPDRPLIGSARCPTEGASSTRPKEPDMTAAQPLTSREVADAIGTDPKTLRRFLRDPKSTYMAAGQGGRYSFVKKDLPGLKKRFTAWSNAETKAREARAAAKAEKAVKAEKAPAKGASSRGMTTTAPAFTAEQRVDRLETMLKARGTHISQHVV